LTSFSHNDHLVFSYLEPDLTFMKLNDSGEQIGIVVMKERDGGYNELDSTTEMKAFLPMW